MTVPSHELELTDYFFMDLNHLTRRQKEITKLIGNKSLSPIVADEMEDVEMRNEKMIILPLQIFFWSYRSN